MLSVWEEWLRCGMSAGRSVSWPRGNLRETLCRVHQTFFMVWKTTSSSRNFSKSRQNIAVQSLYTRVHVSRGCKSNFTYKWYVWQWRVILPAESKMSCLQQMSMLRRYRPTNKRKAWSPSGRRWRLHFSLQPTIQTCRAKQTTYWYLFSAITVLPEVELSIQFVRRAALQGESWGHLKQIVGSTNVLCKLSFEEHEYTANLIERGHIDWQSSHPEAPPGK